MVDLEHAEQVETELVGEVGRTRAEQWRRVVAGAREDRERDRLHPADRVRVQRAQRELRRGDLGG